MHHTGTQAQLAGALSRFSTRARITSTSNHNRAGDGTDESMCVSSLRFCGFHNGLMTDLCGGMAATTRTRRAGIRGGMNIANLRFIKFHCHNADILCAIVGSVYPLKGYQLSYPV